MRYRYREEHEMKDSGVEWIGKIPKGWEIKKIKHLFELKKDKSNDENPTVLSLTQKGLKIRDISNNEGQLASTYVGYIKIEKNDFILNPMDLISGYTDKSEIEGVISPAYTTFRNRENTKINHDFYKMYFQMHYHHNFLFPWGEGVSFDHRWTLKNETFLNLPVIFNTIEEQEKIANFLDEKTSQFDLIISKKEELIQRLEEAKKSLISEVVTGKVNVVKSDYGYDLVKRSSEDMKDSGVEWIKQMPKDWKLPSLSKCTILGAGGTPNRNNIEYWNEGQIPWMSSGEVNQEFITDTKEKITKLGMMNSNAKLLPKNTVMLGLIGQGKTKGKVAILGIEATCNQNLAYLIPNEKILNYKYLYYCMKSMYEYLRGLVGESQAGIYLTLVRTLRIPLPSLAHQKHISEYLDAIIINFDKSISKTKLQIEKLKEAKQSLISEAVTGKIEILD